MKLPGNFSNLFKKKDKKSDLLLAVVFEQAKITVAVFSSQKTQANILAYKSVRFTGEIENVEELVDQLLARLADEVAEVEDLQASIFGFPKEFIEQDKVKPEILRKLQKLTKELSLTPVGFIVISEALAIYLSSKSGSKESAIFVGVYPKEIRISLLKIGQIVEEKTVSRTEKISFDVVEALNSFKQEILPAKIVLYNSSHDLESAKEELLSFPWEQKANFLHFPKIEILPTLATLKAVIGAYTDKTSVVIGYDRDFEADDKIRKETVKPEELGFSAAEAADKVQKGQELEAKKTEPLIVKKKYTEQSRIVFDKKRFGLAKFSFLQFMGQLSILQQIKIPARKYIVLLLILIAGIGGLAWWYTNIYSSSVEIRILVDAIYDEQELEFTLDPKAKSIDVKEKVIPGEEIIIKLKGEKTKDTSGTKLIGDPATGEVTIYNKTTKAKTFGKGEVIIADNKLKFTLGKEVKVASASESVDALTFGKVDVEVTAKEIGPEGNLSGGSEFTFEEYPKDSYIARNKDAFSGGKSREVSVVSEDDVSRLRKKLIADLTKKAGQEIESKKEGKLTVLDETITSNIVKEKLSTKIGEQAKSVTLKATVEFTALAFNPDDIALLLKENAGLKAKKGFVIQEGESRQRILGKKINKDGSVSFQSSFATSFIPEIKIDELKTKAAGMTTGDFEKFMRSQKNIGGIEITFDKKLPFFSPKTLPKDPAKITITITPR